MHLRSSSCSYGPAGRPLQRTSDWQRQMLAATPIVVGSISLTVGPCGIQIVPAWIFQARVAVDVIAASRILRQFLKQLIPTGGSWIACKPCSVVGKKPFMLSYNLQLSFDCLDVRLNAHGFGDGSRVPEFCFS